VITWAVTDALRIYRDGKLVAEIQTGQFPNMIYELAKALRR